jgi:hypothetical protein
MAVPVGWWWSGAALTARPVITLLPQGDVLILQLQAPTSVQRISGRANAPHPTAGIRHAVLAPAPTDPGVG